MLTPVDVQLLVGLLSLATSPTDVQVELGSKVFDVAAEKERDVDVTVLSKHSDGTASAYVGIEVKAETRPLGTQEAEELIAKLRDMPAITRRLIVSASGYTAPAKRKAAYHGIELLQLRRWVRSERVFPFIGSEFETSFVARLRGWVGLPSIAWVTDAPTENGLSATTLMMSADGQLSCLLPFALAFAQRELDSLSAAGVLDDIAPGARRNLRRDVTFRDRVTAWPGSQPIRILGAIIEGDIECTEQTSSPEMKVLSNADTDAPHAACIVGLLPNNDLCGAIFTPQGQTRMSSRSR